MADCGNTMLLTIWRHVGESRGEFPSYCGKAPVSCGGLVEKTDQPGVCLWKVSTETIQKSNWILLILKAADANFLDNKQDCSEESKFSMVIHSTLTESWTKSDNISQPAPFDKKVRGRWEGGAKKTMEFFTRFLCVQITRKWFDRLWSWKNSQMLTVAVAKR